MANRHSRGQHNGIQIRLRHSKPLSNRGIESTRIAALTVLEQATHPGPLQVFSTHIARGDECQMERVGQIVRDGLGAGPSLLMGDFNTPETSKVLTTLRNEAGFVDAFRVVNPEATGPTVWQRIEVEPSTASRRVDFIFLLHGRESMASVRSSRIVLDRPGRLPDGTALWPSDHYGVLAELEILPSPAHKR